MGKLLGDFGRWIGKGLKNPVGAFTAGNLASDWFKLGVYKPNNQPESPVHNQPSNFSIGSVFRGMSTTTMLIVGGVVLVLLLKK